MFHFNLTEKEVDRVKAAARYVGFPWRPIVTRPEVARQFYRRVEAEMRRNGDSPKSCRTWAGELIALG